VAVRVPGTGEIRVDRGELTAPIYTNPVWKLPFVRGLALLAEQIHLGTRSLSWSAQVNAGAQDIQIGGREVAISLAAAAIGSILLFFGLPLLGASLTVHRSNSFWFVLVEGLIRVALVLGYLSLIALMRDVRRVFQYHGAEHKAIAAYENEVELTPDTAQQFSTAHVRCGTNFLLTVMVIAIVVYAVIPRPNLFAVIGSRIVLVPLIAGISYEVIRLAAKHMNNRYVRAAMRPGLLLQRLTTRQPDLDQLEVAIASLRAVMTADQLAEVDARVGVRIPAVAPAV
jgi:uncharacterized protein YqhQ